VNQPRTYKVDAGTRRIATGYALVPILIALSGTAGQLVSIIHRSMTPATAGVIAHMRGEAEGSSAPRSWERIDVGRPER
jgi:hypothetical protein